MLRIPSVAIARIYALAGCVG